MNPETWRSISNFFLIAGIVFLVLTIWLSVNFHLISIIRAEINNRKDKKISDEQDYFIPSQERNNEYHYISPVENSDKDDKNNSSTVLAPQNTIPNNSSTVLAPQNTIPNNSSTVPALQNNAVVGSNGTVIVSSAVPVSNNAAAENVHENNSINSINDDFVISENIIIIHGTPSSIRNKVML